MPKPPIQLPPLPLSPPEGGKFTIDLVPVVPQEDKYYLLSNLSVVNGLTNGELGQLGFAGDSEDWKVSETKKLFFRNKLTQKNITVPNSSWLKWAIVKDSCELLFQVEAIQIQGNLLLIKTTDNELFSGNIEDYLQVGVSTLKLINPQEASSVLHTHSKGIHTCQNGILEIKGSSQKFSIAADTFCNTDIGAKQLCIVKDNLLQYHQHSATECKPISKKYDLSDYGSVTNIATDANNNFYFLITEQEGKNKLRILNRKTLKEVQEGFEGITKIVYMSDTTGKLFCMDSEGYLRVVQVQTNSLPRGYVDNHDITVDTTSSDVIKIQDSSKHALAEALKNGITLTKPLPGTQSADHSPDTHGLTEGIWQIPIGGDTLQSLYDAAITSADIEMVVGACEQISRIPAVSAVPEALKPVQSAIQTKRTTIMLAEIETELGALVKTLPMLTDFTAMIALRESLQTVRQKRSQIAGANTGLDTTLKETMKSLDEKIVEYQENHLSEIEGSITRGLTEIEEILNQIDYLTGLTSVYTSQVWQDTDGAIGYLPQTEQKKHRDALHALVKKRQDALASAEKNKKKLLSEALTETVKRVEAKIEQTEIIIDTLETDKDLENYRTNDPLIQIITSECEVLPMAESQRLKLLLDGIFRERSLQIRLRERDNKGVERHLDDYGIDTELYFVERHTEKVDYSVIGKRTAHGTIRLELQLSNGGLQSIDFDNYLAHPEEFGGIIGGKMGSAIQPEISQREFIELQGNIAEWRDSGQSNLARLQKELRNATNEKQTSIGEKIISLKKRYKKARFVDLIARKIIEKKGVHARPHTVKLDPRFIVLDEEKALLKKISDGMMIQKETGKGIDILEGPPGLGKTELMRCITGATNRQIIRVQCAKMDPSDMFFAPQVKAGETSRQPAEWIRLMQEPGVVILFDEIDKLSPECFDRLHSLFDGGRSVFDPQIGSIKAHSDAVFVGTRNSYQAMTNPITSRATIILMEAPSADNEAFKVSKYTHIPLFEKMDFEEFKKMNVRYGDSFQSTDPAEKKVAQTFKNIRGLVKILHTLRGKQKSDNFDDKFEYEVSYRDAEQIFLRYNRNPERNFGDIVKEILIPKARAVVHSSEDKDRQEKIALLK